MVTKERLHELIEALPEAERATAARLLEALAGLEPGEPVYTPQTAPLDDEPETEEERATAAEGLADLAAGRVVTQDELERRYGSR